MLKYAVFVIAIIHERTQNILRLKIESLLKFIKIYFKRKNVFINNINATLTNIARNFQHLMSINHASLNYQLFQINRNFYVLKNDISFKSNFDNEMSNNNVVDSFNEKKI